MIGCEKLLLVLMLLLLLLLVVVLSRGRLEIIGHLLFSREDARDHLRRVRRHRGVDGSQARLRVGRRGWKLLRRCRVGGAGLRRDGRSEAVNARSR